MRWTSFTDYLRSTLMAFSSPCFYWKRRSKYDTMEKTASWIDHVSLRFLIFFACASSTHLYILFLRYAAISISENEDGKLIIKCFCKFFFFHSHRYEYISSFQAPLMKWKKWRVWILWEGTGATSQRMLGSKLLFHQLNRLFPVPKTLYFEVRLSVKPLVWKWVKFTWELKIMFMVMVLHLASPRNRGLR